MTRLPKALLAATAGAIGGLAAIPVLAAGLFATAPLTFVLFALGLIWIQRLGVSAPAPDRSRVRLAWKASAWLLLAGGLAVPLRNVPGDVTTVGLVAASALIGAIIDATGDRIVPA